MKLSRDTALRIHFILDQLVPPILRDSRWFMALPMRLFFRHRYKDFLDFKAKAYAMTEEEFRETYRRVSDVSFSRETDLNVASIEKILAHTQGRRCWRWAAGMDTWRRN